MGLNPVGASEFFLGCICNCLSYFTTAKISFTKLKQLLLCTFLKRPLTLGNPRAWNRKKLWPGVLFFFLAGHINLTCNLYLWTAKDGTLYYQVDERTWQGNKVEQTCKISPAILFLSSPAKSKIRSYNYIIIIFTCHSWYLACFWPLAGRYFEPCRPYGILGYVLSVVILVKSFVNLFLAF